MQKIEISQLTISHFTY